MTSERPKVERLTILVNLKFSFREQNAFAYDNYAKVGRFNVNEKVFLARNAESRSKFRAH